MVGVTALALVGVTALALALVAVTAAALALVALALATAARGAVALAVVAVMAVTSFLMAVISALKAVAWAAVNPVVPVGGLAEALAAPALTVAACAPGAPAIRAEVATAAAARLAATREPAEKQTLGRKLDIEGRAVTNCLLRVEQRSPMRLPGDSSSDGEGSGRAIVRGSRRSVAHEQPVRAWVLTRLMNGG